MITASKIKTPTANREPLKCDMPFDEALRRAMTVKPPESWKPAKHHKKPVR